jgi:hypothetical protein
MCQCVVMAKLVVDLVNSVVVTRKVRRSWKRVRVGGT